MNALLEDSDRGLDEEIEQESSIELRVLHGAQSGSSLVLAPGEYVLGGGDSCAVILAGPHIADRHATLRFDGAKASIEPAEGIVRNAYGDEIDAEQELVFGLPVDLGGVIITVDQEEAPWPDPQSVMLMGQLRESANEEDEQDGEQDEEAADAVGAELDAAAAMFETADKTPVAVEVPPSGRLSRARGWLLALLLLAGLGGLGTIAWQRLVEQTAAPASSTVAEASVAIDQAPAMAVEVLANLSNPTLALKKAGAKWQVVGYVQTNGQQASLSSAMAAAAPSVEVKVLADESLLRDVRNSLAEETLDAYVRVDGVALGVVTLSGAASSAEEIGRIRDLVREKVPGVADIKLSLLLPDQLRGRLKERIAAAGLADRLVVRQEGKELRLAGKLSTDEIRRWEEVLVAFGKEYGNVLPISATVTRYIPKPPVGVQIIVGGAMPFIVTENGEHVNQGGNVDGHTLMSIRDGEVVFEGSQRIRIAR